MNRPLVAMASAAGFTLVELMLVVLLIALLVTTAWPTWRGYQDSAADAALTANVQSMSIFQEDYRIRHGRYATDLADQQQITTALGWQLAKEDGSTYLIDAGDGEHYVVHGHAPDGQHVCLVMPKAQPCEI
ncbi:MAG: prepilin-type N-terminal cleavage/methylation domain-containing protein [Proteobacteria bacterium]|nr:prepilin-type N-terminal cleavage/methylation domain-containing protein [Pseudomonadota bacterium]